MPVNRNQNGDYKSLGSSKKNGETDNSDLKTLKSKKNREKERLNTNENGGNNLVNYNKDQEQKISSHYMEPVLEAENDAEKIVLKPKKSPKRIEKEKSQKIDKIDSKENLDEHYAQKVKREKEEKRKEKDYELLSNESWIARNGHNITFVGLFLFSFVTLFRPYELIPGLGFLKSTAFYFAAATLAIFIPTQLSAEGRISIFSTEVKAITALALLALISIGIAKDPAMAWEEFNGTFIKAVLMFIVMVNVIRTRTRLMTMLWLSIGIGLILGYMAMGMYWRGEVTAEGYRVVVDIGGIYANPNDLALHLVTMIPIALCLGLASKNVLMRLVYLTATIFMMAGCMVTYSRGGFLGLVAAMGVLIWKFGRKNRLNVTIASVVAGTLVVLFAPGNYGMRILSIFGLAPDAVGSSDQRTELLKRSIIVSIRNPWGIGIGNFPIVGIRNLVSHNAYTQVSAEIGVLGLLAYLVFMVSPFRKLGAIERTLFHRDEPYGWFYYLSVGLQASIIGYMVSSFFISVAYNWFIYYLIAYAVAFRRIYQIEKGLKEEVKADSLTENIFNWRKKSA